MDKNIIVYQIAGGELAIFAPDDILVSRKHKLEMKIKELKAAKQPYLLLSKLPPKKYRQAWEINEDWTDVVVNKEKALGIAKGRATAALIACKNRMTARGRSESIRTGEPYTGLSEQEEREFRASLKNIEKSVSVKHLETVEKLFKNK